VLFRSRLVARYAGGVAGVESGPAESERKWATIRLRPDERRLLRKVHQALRHVTEDMEERWHFNTDIAMIMELSNEFADLQAAVDQGQIRSEVLKSCLEHLIVMLSLFAPHVADELWEATGHPQPLLRFPWPAYDPELAAEDELEIPVQVNGRLRGRIRVAVGASEEEIRRLARADPSVAQHLNGRQVVRLIVVRQKLVNIVIK